MSEAEINVSTVTESKTMHKKKNWIGKETKAAFFLTVPTLLVLLILIILPMIYNFVLSFFSWDLITDARFIGLQNYIDLIRSKKFPDSVSLTLLFTVISFALEFSIGMGIALLLNQVDRGQRLIRSAILIPMMLTPIVIGLVWRMLFNQEFGLLNYFLTTLGFGPLGWIVKPNLAVISIIIAEVWHMTGYVVLILSAGLASLPDEPYEAAKIDGASFWQTLWYISLPLLKPLIIVLCVFRSVELIRIFDMVYTLTGGGPGRATETISFSIFSDTFTGWQIGYGAAGSIVIFLITACLGLYLISKEKESF